MKRLINKEILQKTSTICLAVLLCFGLYAQCTEDIQKKIFLVGDSWATFMWYDGTLKTVAQDWGHSNVDYYTHLTLNEAGSQTDDFLKPEKIAKLTQELAERPELKVVHLSVAGNDFLGSWKASFSQEQIQNLYDDMIERLDSIIDTIHALRPDIHIVWSGYTYTNFQESIEALPSSFRSQHPFYSNWQNMEFPTPAQINALQNWFQQEVKARYANDSKFTYVPSSSILQYTFGQNENLTIPPGGTYPPYSVDVPLGLENYPSPLSSMRHYATIPIVNIPIKDAFHLSSQGYYDFISYQFQKFYHKFFMDDEYSLANYEKTGGVSNSAVLQKLQVGKNGTEEYVGILHFDNTHWQAYVPEKVSLFLRIDSLAGTNFLSTNNFEIDIVKGHFGDFATLDLSDFSMETTLSTSACLFGNNNENKWIRLDFPESIAQQFRNEEMQLRLRYTGSTDGLSVFENSENIDFQAVLNVKYSSELYSEPEDPDPELPEDPQPEVPDEPEPEDPEIPEPEEEKPVVIVGVDDQQINNKIYVFPNPVGKQRLNIVAEQAIDEVLIFDLSGKLQIHYKQPNNYVDVESLKSGMYIIEIQTNGQKERLKIVKSE